MLGLNAQLLPLSEWLVRTTVQGTVVICLILLVKTVLRDKLPIRWHYWLWLLLLVRIFLPWAPSSQLSIFNFIPASLEVGGLAPFGKGAGFFRFVDILPYVWLIGALILSGYVLLRSFRLWRTVKRERPITDQKILDLLEDCKMQMSVQTILGVVVTDRVKSPALFGFIRPRLLLPEGMIERHQLEELRYIFIHELGHLKQRDIYLSWLMTLFQVVYWFNPLMWFAIRRIRLEREFACDGLALSNLRPDEPARYGHTIVNLLEKFSQVSYVPSVAGILEDTSQIERRIKMITKFKKTSRTRSVGAVLLVAILACVVLTDPYPAKADFTFGTPTNLGPIVNSTYMDCHPSISADGLSLYFTSDQPGGSGGRDLWLVTRATTEDDWNTPIWLGPTVNSSANDGAPCISADGLSLYFGSGRPGGYGGGDIWVTTRSTIHDDWGTPENLGWPVNISYEEVGPSISADGLTLFFFSMPSLDRYTESEIWVTTRASASDPWEMPVNLGPVVNSSAWDGWPNISPDACTLFFASERPGGSGGTDLWVTTRPTTSDPWGPPVNLGPTVNSAAQEFSPNISADGGTLFFASWSRPGGFGSNDLWQVPVFPEPVCGDDDHPYPVGDLNKDCRVDFADVAALFAHWLVCTAPECD